MMWGDGFGMGAGWLVMLLGTVAFWVVVVLVIRALLPSGAARSTGPGEALRVLDERLARGDVTPEEYEQRRRLIVDGR